MQCNLSNRRLARALTEALEGRRLLSGLAITYDSNGISTLAYNGDVLTNVPTRGAAEGFQVNRYYTLNTDGTYAAIYGGAAYSSNWNASTHTLTYTYPAFGSITVQYVCPADAGSAEHDFHRDESRQQQRYARRCRHLSCVAAFPQSHSDIRARTMVSRWSMPASMGRTSSPPITPAAQAAHHGGVRK